ncbi:hypothetical protein SAMN05428977_100758 [Nitrosomonas sp. Nm166]|nr:hypothetical protein SAMN05428977_100758 [Nitrosomonas sp. Nm166]
MLTLMLIFSLIIIFLTIFNSDSHEQIPKKIEVQKRKTDVLPKKD